MFTLVCERETDGEPSRLSLTKRSLSQLRDEADALERDGWKRMELRRESTKAAGNAPSPQLEKLRAALLVYEATVYTMAVYLLDVPDYVWKQIIAAADAYEEVTGEESVCRDLRQVAAVETCRCPDRT